MAQIYNISINPWTYVYRQPSTGSGSHARVGKDAYSVPGEYGDSAVDAKGNTWYWTSYGGGGWASSRNVQVLGTKNKEEENPIPDEPQEPTYIRSSFTMTGLNNNGIDLEKSFTIKIAASSTEVSHKVEIIVGGRTQSAIIRKELREYSISPIKEFAWNILVPNKQATAKVRLWTIKPDGNAIAETAEAYIFLRIPNVAPFIPIRNGTSLVLKNPSTVPVAYENRYLQGISTAIMTTKWSAFYGATIKSIKVSILGQTLDGSDSFETPIQTDLSNTYKITVTDTRGLTAEHTGIIRTDPQPKPFVSSVKINRVNNQGQISDDGQYVNIKFAYNLKKLIKDKAHTISFSSATKGGTFASMKTFGQPEIPDNLDEELSFDSGVLGISNNGATQTPSPFETTISYEIKMVINNGSTSEEYTWSLPTAVYAMHFRPNNEGVAFGKVCENPNIFDIAETWSAGTGMKKLLLEAIYPVGSIYQTTNANFDPNKIFGGKWDKIYGRFLLGHGTGYDMGNVGGNATHTLTQAEMPRHYHETQAAIAHSTSSTSAPWSRELVPGTGFKNISNTGEVSGYAALTAVYQGASQPHNNMPPYLAIAIWERKS